MTLRIDPATYPRMIEPRRVASCLRTFALAVLLTACGGSDDQSRPIEVIFYVDGLSGTRFQVEGLQSANFNHRLTVGDDPLPNAPLREFEAPFFFVLENARQLDPGPGIRGCFRNLDTTTSINIFVYYGTVFQGIFTLGPGESGGPGPCKVVVGIDPAEVRFEVCPDTGGNTRCQNAPATGVANIAFTASIGDLDATNITTCSIPEATVSFCTTPSIFYLENPADRLQGIFTKLAFQNPNVFLRADVYVGGTFRTSETNDDDVIIDEEF